MIGKLNKIFDSTINKLVNSRDAVMRKRIRRQIRKNKSENAPSKQSLDVYWDEDFITQLESWGQGTVWTEIQHLLAARQGRVLDIACGVGATMRILNSYKNLEIYGCDIGDLNIKRAIQLGLPESRLKVCDATDTKYENSFFEHAYSIGSLEHFTEEGICNLLKECKRITKHSSFHQIPTSRSGLDEGWIVLQQSYFNNSVEWWLKHFNKVFEEVYFMDSSWNDTISLGKWFVCVNGDAN